MAYEVYGGLKQLAAADRGSKQYLGVSWNTAPAAPVTPAPNTAILTLNKQQK